MSQGAPGDVALSPESDALILRGQPLRSWAESLQATDDASFQAASDAFRRLGDELVATLPALAATLSRRNGDNLAQAATDLGFIGVRLHAVLGRFRAALRDAILIHSDETVRTCALHALALLGPTSTSRVPQLVAELRDPLPSVRAAAAQELAELGGEARDSVPAIISSCLHDPDLAVRVHAGVALWRVGRRASPATQALVEGLRSDDPVLCWTAADCLGDMGPEASGAVPALKDALARIQRPLIATSILLALERIDPQAAAAAQPS